MSYNWILKQLKTVKLQDKFCNAHDFWNICKLKKKQNKQINTLDYQQSCKYNRIKTTKWVSESVISKSSS